MTNETPQTRSLSIADCNKLQVMVVDPNGYMRGIVTDALRRISVGGVFAAASADEANEACMHFHPNLVIIDWEAGNMSGLEFTRAIRRSTKNMPRETPIILLASTVARDQLVAARQAGINELLLKPVSVRALKSRIEEIILRPRKFIDSRNYVGPCRRRKQVAEYNGPFRRLTDEPPQEEDDTKDPKRFDKLRAIVSQLSGYAVRDTDDFQGISRGLFKLLSNYQSGIDAMGDEYISQVWKSVLRYIEGVGMSPNYDAQVILRHFEAITVMLEMPPSADPHRETVVKDLNRLVTKKIHALDRNIRQPVPPAKETGS